MLTYEDALARILARARPLLIVRQPLLDCLGLLLAEDIHSTLSLPPFASSSMDGFALRHADIAHATTQTPVHLPISGDIPAGCRSVPTLPLASCLRIMTGAPLPPGADTVIPVEDADDANSIASIRDPGACGQFIRPLGSDITPGLRLLTKGTRIRPQEIAVAAALGLPTLPVRPRPRVAILSTGDELIEPGSPLPSGAIYNSNTYALAAQVHDAGGIVVARLLARDTPASLRAAFDGCADADLILASGGVSVGAYDHVKSVFAERGQIDFWRVAIRPGKPLTFGTWGKALFFGLPGNPVSSLVTFELFARPALRRLMGDPHPLRPAIRATLTAPIFHDPGRRTFLRATLTLENDQYLARADTRQGSHQLSALPASNALLVLPEDVPTLPAGAFVTALLLSDAFPL